MKPKMKVVDEKPVASTPVILEDSPEEIRNMDSLDTSSIVIRQNKQTLLSKGIKLIVILSIAVMAVWLAVWIGMKFRARTRVTSLKGRTQLVLKGQTCGWVEFNEKSQDVLFMVKTSKFQGFIVDCYSENLEVIIPRDRNKKVCYVLPTRNFTFSENMTVVPYFQERGFHKFDVFREMVNDSFLCEVSRNLCRGMKLVMIRPSTGREKKSLSGSEERNVDDDDVFELYLL